MKSHNWPADGEHLWSKWMNKTPRRGAEPPLQYRICVHPECNKSETRTTPSA